MTIIPFELLKCFRFHLFLFTLMSPTVLFPFIYFAVFCLAISWSISSVLLFTFPNPNVRMTTELFSSKFMSLIVWNIGPSSSSGGASSVRNNITLVVLLFPFSSEAEAFRRLKAFSKSNLYRVPSPGTWKRYHQQAYRKRKRVAKIPHWNK